RRKPWDSRNGMRTSPEGAEEGLRHELRTNHTSSPTNANRQSPRRLFHHHQTAAITTRTTATTSNRFTYSSTRCQCWPNRYPAPEITVTHTAAPRKLNIR